LPTSRSDVFHTYHDRQQEVEIDIYQGENEDVRRNHRVGRFLVQGLAPVPAGNQIVVQFDLNLDGILHVTAREKATGLQKQVTIENALARFEREERDAARERLQRLWLGSEQEDEEDELEDEEDEVENAPGELPTLAPGPREGQREAVQARALLEKAERLLERVSPEDRAEVERLMERVRTALTDRQWEQLTAASNDLTDTLFYLEDA
jgi:molecular chaperone DnaK